MTPSLRTSLRSWRSSNPCTSISPGQRRNAKATCVVTSFGGIGVWGVLGFPHPWGRVFVFGTQLRKDPPRKSTLEIPGYIIACLSWMPFDNLLTWFVTVCVDGMFTLSERNELEVGDLEKALGGIRSVRTGIICTFKSKEEFETTHNQLYWCEEVFARLPVFTTNARRGIPQCKLRCIGFPPTLVGMENDHTRNPCAFFNNYGLIAFFVTGAPLMYIGKMSRLGALVFYSRGYRALRRYYAP